MAVVRSSVYVLRDTTLVVGGASKALRFLRYQFSVQLRPQNMCHFHLLSSSHQPHAATNYLSSYISGFPQTSGVLSRGERFNEGDRETKHVPF
jgi:hypothetical protein